MGDPLRIQQILTNLLSNAIKFTEEGEVKISVRCDSLPDGETSAEAILFEVADTGIGIAEDEVGHIFNYFDQAAASTTRMHGGSGLGLAISLKLAALMKGDISVESKEGAGSTFCFSVPLVRAVAESESSFDCPDTPLRCLVVGSASSSMEILKHYMEHKNGVFVKTLLPDAAQAQVLEDDTRYDVVIFAVQLFDQSQLLELARSFSANRALKEVPFVCLISRNQRRALADEEKALFKMTLSKPVRRSKLFDCLESIRVNKLQYQPVAANEQSTSTRVSVKVLVADDSMIDRMIILGILTKMGIEGDVAESSKHVLPTLGKKRYDVLIMDCHMLGLDGFKVAQKIRKLDKYKELKIIGVSADVMQDNVDHAKRVGMDTLLTKPISNEQFLRIFEMLKVIGCSEKADGSS